VTSRGSRWALCCLALLLAASLMIKGRVPTRNGEDAAFSFARSPASVTVRLAGDFPRPGVYRFPGDTTVTTAIKMTVPVVPLAAGDSPAATRRLASGDVVTLRLRGRQIAVLALERMSAREQMVLGVALDPDRLEAPEWAALPGIGPVLAERIVVDRHNNGAFGSLDGVLRVPGIGQGKLKAIRRYF